MKCVSSSARVRLAEAELAAAQNTLEKNAMSQRCCRHTHSGALSISCGFFGGFALTLLPTRWWAYLGAFAGKGAAIAARSVFLPMLIGALLVRNERGASAHLAKQDEKLGTKNPDRHHDDPSRDGLENGRQSQRSNG